MRRCETCGGKLGPFEARQRNPKTGAKECGRCRNPRPHVAASGFVNLHDHTWGEGVDGDVLLRPGRYKVAAVDEYGTWVEHEGTKVVLAETHVASEDYPVLSDILVERPPLERQGSRKHAHDSGDGETIYHCPMCGSGNVVGRSDGTVECAYCNSVFTVQVQPSNPNMPQTVDGQPYDIPGMPGQIDKPQPGDPSDPSPAGPPAGDLPPFGSEDEEASPEDDVEGEENPFTKGSARYITQDGIALPEREYIAHLARKHRS